MQNLDYKIKESAARKAIVQDILRRSKDNLTPQEISYLSDYLVESRESKRKRSAEVIDYPILTRNRIVTITKREQSLDSLISGLPGGEDAVAHLIRPLTNKQSYKLDYKAPITQQDLDMWPVLAAKMEYIQALEEQLHKPNVSGNVRYSLKKTIIETYKEMYVIKSQLKQPTKALQCAKPSPVFDLINFANVDAKVEMMENPKISRAHPDARYPTVLSGISFLDENHCQAFVKHIPEIEQQFADYPNTDMWYMVQDFHKLVEESFKDRYELFWYMMQCRFAGLSVKRTASLMTLRYGISFSPNNISPRFNRTIPHTLALHAQRQYVKWYYTAVEPLGCRWKPCGKCGKSQPAHPYFFTTNSNKAGYYSICKECRRTMSHDKWEGRTPPLNDLSPEGKITMWYNTNRLPSLAYLISECEKKPYNWDFSFLDPKDREFIMAHLGEPFDKSEIEF